MAAQPFKILIKWTQKGVEEIDNAVDRRPTAITLMKSYLSSTGARLITFTSGDDTGASDIKYLGDKKSHILWTVTGERSDVKDFADDMEYHGYVKCRIKRAGEPGP